MDGSATALVRLVVAALIGFLIGLDRERAETRKARPLFAGVRTFPLVALAGAVPMLLTPELGPWLVIASFVVVGGVALISYARSAATGAVGATTEIAAIATFLLGTLAGAGELEAAAATGVAVAVLLVAKPRLERFSRTLTEDELAAALELAVVAVIVLPLVPNREFGPWGVWNPFDIWFVVVLVHGLSFLGFIAMRVMGNRRGLLAAGAVGALVSSTAVTVAMASYTREDRQLSPMAATSAVLASVLMGFRVLVFAAAIDLGIVPRLAPIVAAMGLVGAVAAWWIAARRPAVRARSTHIANPFRLTSALLFGLVYAGVLVAVPAAKAYAGAAGLYGAALLSSLVDVDAVAIAFTHLGSGATGWPVAALAVSCGIVVNTLVKLGIAVIMGSREFARSVAVSLASMAVVGAVVAIWVANT